MVRLGPDFLEFFFWLVGADFFPTSALPPLLDRVELASPPPGVVKQIHGNHPPRSTKSPFPVPRTPYPVSEGDGVGPNTCCPVGLKGGCQLSPRRSLPSLHRPRRPPRPPPQVMPEDGEHAQWFHQAQPPPSITIPCSVRWYSTVPGGGGDDAADDDADDDDNH